jgi:Mg2+/Co2+ transporter CorC
MMHDSVRCILQEELSQKRVALSVLLMDLLSQQAERRRQLLNTLTEMEKRRWVDEEVGEYSETCLICAMKVPW